MDGPTDPVTARATQAVSRPAPRLWDGERPGALHTPPASRRALRLLILLGGPASVVSIVALSATSGAPGWTVPLGVIVAACQWKLGASALTCPHTGSDVRSALRTGYQAAPLRQLPRSGDVD